LTVKILTNCHNLLGNPLHGPMCVLRKCIPHRIKIRQVRSVRACRVGLLSLSYISVRRLCAFVRFTLIRCDGCGTIFPSSDCVRQWHTSALLRGTSTVPFCLGWWYLVSDNKKKLNCMITVKLRLPTKLLTSSLSLGVPVPRATQCMRVA
jgi:hypothetical protein